jgi:hypothetical protein
VRPRDIPIYTQISQGLENFERLTRPLPGIADTASRATLLLQMLDSVHRVRYPAVIRSRKLSPQVTDPDSIAFDPIKAAALHQRNGDVDEACWLVFLFVHFGKHGRGGWRYIKEIYAGRGTNHRWTWATTSADPQTFREWLRANATQIGRKTDPGGFGGHRKYESLDADKPNGTGSVVESYVRWINPPRTHSELLAEAAVSNGGEPRLAFAALYESMAAVHRFGRTARFDYLAMLGKLELANIIPDKAYLRDATGPKKGAQLLFGAGRVALGADELEAFLQQLDDELHVGMQVLEDALCNWQKDPSRYVPFRG